MKCPNCDNDLNQIRIPSLNSGLFILIDQCQKCGGVWLDQNELYQIPINEAKDIDNVNIALFDQNTVIRPDLFCPNDGTKLIGFKDFNFPAHIYIKQCRTCGGFWMNRGEISKFKEHVKAKQDELREWEKERTANQDISRKDEFLSNFGFALGSSATSTNSLVSPLVLSDGAGEFLRQVPKDKKIQFYRMMMDEGLAQRAEWNKTTRMISIILSILRFLIFHF